MEILTNRDGDPIELVKRGILVACAPGFSDRQPETVQELMQYRFSNPVPPAQYQAQVAAGAGMAVFSDDEVQERMAKIKSSTLLLFGEFDNVVPSGNAELMAAKIYNAEIKIIPGAGHMYPIEAPQAASQAIVDFLK
jgi:pimeloyl-ACP methyl ester carboxylesterase